MKEKQTDDSKALRDKGMSSPSELRNNTAPRKVKDMPEDGGYKDRDAEQDYQGPAKKNH